MTGAQFSAAAALALDAPRVPLAENTEILHGCGLRGFQPVTIRLETAAAFIRYQCLNFDGTTDAEELNQLAQLFRRRVTIA